jgi:hypothetical protein
MRQQGFDEVVYGWTGFDEEHDSARSFKERTQFLDGMSTDNGFSCNQYGIGKNEAPLASFAMKWSTLETVRLNAATVNPRC